jgi:PAS domain S-box-containing protein
MKNDSALKLYFIGQPLHRHLAWRDKENTLGKATSAELEAKIKALEEEIASCKTEKYVQVHTELQEQQARYKRLFHYAPMGILLMDAEARYVDANHKALEILGYRLEQISRMTAYDLIHPDDLNAQPLIMPQDIADPDRDITLERDFLCSDGRYLPVEVHLSLFSKDLMIITFRDISQCKGAEKALKAANEALEVVYRCSNAAIISLDHNNCVTFWNPAAEKIFGWTQQEVIGKPFPAIPEDKQDEYETIFKEKMKGKAFTDLEVVSRKKNGGQFHVSSTTGPLRNDKGEVTGLISVMIDITRRKRTEEALQQSEERYRSLVENTRDGYFVCDTFTGRFRFLNQRMCDLLGYNREEALQLTLWDVLAKNDHSTMRTLIESQREGPRTNADPGSFIAVRKQGTQFRAEISAALVTFNEKPAIQGLLRDVTEKERLHAKLQQAQRLESVGTLAGGLAHDFNNLLMAIQGNASLALTKLETTHPIYEKVKNITTYVQDASELTKQLLGFARGGKYEVKATHLNNLIQKTAQMFGRTKKEITIRIKPQHNLWTVEVDRGQIEQVLLNLLVNAWQAMPNGGQVYIQTSNVELDSTYAKAYNVKPGEYAKISVTDTGIGMNKRVQNKIFEPFFTTKERSRGTGLGLASAYGIIKNHDGIINIYSEKGKGSTFTIYLPATQSAKIVGAKSDISPLPGTETVLLVDDEEIILEVASELLQELGYRTCMARNGLEAVETYLNHQDEIDVVILDMIMPGMSGGETYDKIRQINPEVKTLLASGYSLDDRASQILRCGCNGFIQKPFNLEELSCKLREVLDNG